MKVLSLNGAWQGRCVEKFDFKANVPGCTISDLISNGHLPSDLLVGKNADLVQKYERCDWVYKKTFSVEQVFDKAILCFERLDTYADVYFNGKHIASTQNGNIAYRFDVSGLVTKGVNKIEMRLYSPVTKVEGMPAREGAFTTERLYTRRTQCTYGWDWVARFVSAGIGKTELLCYNATEPIVKDVYVYTEKILSNTALIKVQCAFEEKVEKQLTLEILSSTGEIAYQENICLKNKEYSACIELKNPELWYPVGYGKQPLHLLRIKDGDIVLREEKFGVRIVEVLEEKDKKGSENYLKCLQIKNGEYDFNEEFSSFTLVVNGIKIMCKGANWVPCQPFEMQGKEEKITQILQLATKMGVNMIRVWGGGAFECEHFYDECSRLGITVTQDFLMACGSYPEKEEWFLKHLQKEAEYACRLMRNKPCLVWYSGDNENAVHGSFDSQDYMGKTAFEKGLKPVVERFDGNRKFFASSPYGGKKFASNTVGTTHNTQFLGTLFAYIFSKGDHEDYKEELKKYRARFIAEEPAFGAVSLSSLKRFMTDDNIFSKDLDMWLYHTKGNPGLERELMDYMIRFAEGVLGKFKDPKDRYFKYKYFMYEWIRVVMEQARREKWFCSGIIFWMLNDCWTAASGWALIDYYNKPKLGCYSFKRCAKPILASIDFENDRYLLSVSNDSLSLCRAKANVYKVKNGIHELVKEIEITCPANENVAIDLDVKLEKGEFLIADLQSNLNDSRAFYKHGGLKIRPIKDAVDFVVEDGVITITAKEYVHAVELEGEAVFEDNGFIMLKGEKIVVPFGYAQDALSKNITVETYTL